MELNCTHRAVIYLRYSSHSQRDVSIEQQLRACRAFAERQGIEIVKVYEDRALTGTNDRRPGFQQMIADSAHGGFDYVIVYSLDRFARDRYDSAVYKRQLKNHGIRVLSAMESISDDPSGVLMESLLEGLAEYYSKELSQKVTRGMEDNARKCMIIGPICYGYNRGKDGRFEINEAEADIVREIFRRVLSGEKQIDIVTDLNARGIRTKLNRRWARQSLQTLLTNVRYVGIYTFRDQQTPGGVPRILDDDTFYAVQHLLGSKPNPRSKCSPGRRRRDNGIYMLTGKIYCGSCGEAMTGISGRGKAGSLFYYYCCKGKHNGTGCRKKNIRREAIEYRVAQLLKETMLTDKGIAALADSAIEWQNAHTDTSELDLLLLRQAETKKSINNIMSAIEAGIFTATTKDRLLQLEDEQRTLTSQISAASAAAFDLLTREQIIAALELYREGTLEDPDYRQLLIDTFLVAVYVYDTKLRIVFNLGSSSTSQTIDFTPDLFPPEDDGVCISDIKVDHSALYEHQGIQVISFLGMFTFLADTKSPT